MGDTDADGHALRVAHGADAGAIGQLLHDFNLEFEEPAPPPPVLAGRAARLIESGETVVILGGDGPDGLALLRFRPGLWSDGLECYLAELYVVRERRGRGLGRALMEAAVAEARDRGADHMDLGTSENDRAARRLYESPGFTNRERGPGGPVMYVYERDLQS